MVIVQQSIIIPNERTHGKLWPLMFDHLKKLISIWGNQGERHKQEKPSWIFNGAELNDVHINSCFA